MESISSIFKDIAIDPEWDFDYLNVTLYGLSSSQDCKILIAK